MIETTMKTLVALLLFTTINESVKIGVSKPVTVNPNSTTESTTTVEPPPTTTTVKPTSLSTTLRATTIKSTQSTKPTTKSTSTTTTTTPIPPTSTTITPPNNGTPASLMRNENIDRTGYFCSCDLRPHFCDINCCCDIDCIAEELNSFDCHREDNRLEDFNYLQGLPPCKINEGWLCVFRTNIDVSKNKHKNYFFDKSIFHEWPPLLREDNDFGKDRSFYKIGEPVLLYNLEINEIIEFDLPFSLEFGQHCEITESVRHLQAKKSSCRISVEKAKTLETTLFQKLCTSFLVQGPNTQLPLDGIVKETLTEFIPIAIFRCTKEYDCIPVSVNNSYFEYLDESINSNLIKIKFTHNITNLKSCEVLFIQSEEKTKDVWLNFEVDFLHMNETQGISLNVSGPLGYTAGRPLIIGHRIPLNESAEPVDSNRIISYFHPNRTEQIHINVPRRRRDQCENSQSTVNFGESILVQCSVQIDNATEITSETNFTKICTDLQDRIFKFLQVSQIQVLQEEYFVSILGYPANKTDYWTKIELRNYEHLPVLGVYLDKDYSFICQNMILSVKYEFLTIKEDVNGVRHQNILEKASLDIGKRLDLQFQLDEVVSIPITFSTVFHDLQVVNEAVKFVNLLRNVLIVMFFKQLI